MRSMCVLYHIPGVCHPRALVVTDILRAQHSGRDHVERHGVAGMVCQLSRDCGTNTTFEGIIASLNLQPRVGCTVTRDQTKLCSEELAELLSSRRLSLEAYVLCIRPGSGPERLQQQLEEDDSTSIRSQQQLGLGWTIWAMVFIALVWHFACAQAPRTTINRNKAIPWVRSCRAFSSQGAGVDVDFVRTRCAPSLSNRLQYLLETRLRRKSLAQSEQVEKLFKSR